MCDVFGRAVFPANVGIMGMLQPLSRSGNRVPRGCGDYRFVVDLLLFLSLCSPLVWGLWGMA